MAKKQNRPRDRVMRRVWKNPPKQYYSTRANAGPEVADDQKVAIGLEILSNNKGREWPKKRLRIPRRSK